MSDFPSRQKTKKNVLIHILCCIKQLRIRYMSGSVIINCSDAKQKLDSTVKSSPMQSKQLHDG